MRACVDPKVREVVVMGASQISKTESCILNVLAYKIVHDPAPSLLVTSTLPACQNLSHDRLEPMFRDCAPLRGLVIERGGPNPDATIYRKSFPDGHLTLAGSNSASGLARMPIRDLYFTEVDRFSVEAGRGEGEGDPVSLARIRTTTFANAKVIMESSPTVSGRSRIEAAYLNSTQEHWYTACPRCGFYQVVTFGRINFETLFHACEHCGEASNQAAWQGSPGEWRPSAEHPSIRGFQISALASPLISWGAIVEEFKVANQLAAEGDPSQLKVWVNTRLAEAFVEKQPETSEDELLVRREPYSAEIPDGVLILLAAIDTQDDRLVYQIAGVGAGRELWLIEYGAIWGDLNTGAGGMYAEVDERILNRVWRFADNRGIKVRRCVQDAMGHHSATVYAQVKKRPGQMIAFKGVPASGQRELYSLKHSATERAPLLLGTVDLAKDLLANLLKVPAPGRGYVHIPMNRGFDQEWSREMVAEKKEVRYRVGQRIAVWTKRNPSLRNEAWDMCVMTLVLLESMRLNLEERVPDYYDEQAEAKAQQQPASARPAWGVISRIPLPSDTDGWQQAVTTRPEDKPRSPWGAINRPIDLRS
jgi:phage terminase large subunit GpA-like protein